MNRPETGRTNGQKQSVRTNQTQLTNTSEPTIQRKQWEPTRQSQLEGTNQIASS